MDMNSKVSVIIPAYNAGACLQRCLDSIVGQTLKDIEIIVVENGSTDNTADIADLYAKKHGNVRLIRNKVKGAGIARNTGIENARGEYIAFVDADDYLSDNMLEELLKLAEEHNCELVACNYYFYAVSDNPFTYGKSVMKYLDRPLDVKETFEFYGQMSVFSHSIWAKLFRRDLLIDNNIRFNQEWQPSEDLPFACEAFLKCERTYSTYSAYYHYTNNAAVGTLSAQGTIAKPKTFINYFLVHLHALKLMDAVPESIVPVEVKRKSYKNIFFHVAFHYIDYLRTCINGMFFCEKIDLERKYLVWGAGGSSRALMDREEGFSDLVVVDSDKSKAGTKYCGYDVISPESLREYYKPDRKFLIATLYIFEVLHTLKELGIEVDINDILPMNGTTKWDKFYSGVLKMFYDEYERLMV